MFSDWKSDVIKIAFSLSINMLVFSGYFQHHFVVFNVQSFNYYALLHFSPFFMFVHLFWIWRFMSLAKFEKLLMLIPQIFAHRVLFHFLSTIHFLLSSQEYGCHSKPFHTLGVILLIYVPEVTGPAVLFSPSKDQRDFQGQAQCLLSFQSPYCNLMLYNVFLLSYLIAVLPINVPEGRGSGSFPGLVLVPRTVPDSW